MNILVSIPATSTISVLASFGVLDLGSMCGTSSDLIASVCSFCSSVQTPQADLLQCLDHSKPPCHLFSFRGHCLPRIFAGTPVHEGLSPIGRHRLADGDASGIICYLMIAGVHAGHTQQIYVIAVFVLNSKFVPFNKV